MRLKGHEAPKSAPSPHQSQHPNTKLSSLINPYHYRVQLFSKLQRNLIKLFHSLIVPELARLVDALQIMDSFCSHLRKLKVLQISISQDFNQLAYNVVLHKCRSYFLM